MSTAEIIAELPRLTRAELAQVQARLAELTAPLPVAVSAPPGWPPRIRSPRLADPDRSADFAKRVVELTLDATL
jgi:hypothetical protein